MLNPAPANDWLLLGVDFTSAPRPAKPIIVAYGRLDGQRLLLLGIEHCADWPAFEALLARPGPWLGGFDFPFGLPREAVEALGWPQQWPELVRHCAALGRDGFRRVLDAYRCSRPSGQRYAHRRTDAPAASHSPLKLVNPPVGLMFLEGAPRLLAAGVDLPGIHPGDPARIALEAYPGLLARRLATGSYKSDERRKQTAARREVRERILAALTAGTGTPALRLVASAAQLAELLDDGSGDRLDAVLALHQVARAAGHGPPRFGLPAAIDGLEGWIIGA